MNNLKAEMARYGISGVDIQKIIECSDRTVRNKLSGESAFTMPEAMKIRDALFPSMRLEYLFKPDEDRHTRDPDKAS